MIVSGPAGGCSRPILEVYSDVWCPFAYVGIMAALQERSCRGRSDVGMVMRAWPLELVNGSPLDATTTTHHVDELRLQVAPTLFTGFNPSRFPMTTLPALALAASAYGRDVQTGEAVSLALRRALFEDGLDVSNAQVIDHLATVWDLGPVDTNDDTAIWSDWESGRERGVQGSPHFFFGEEEAFCPTLDIERDSTGHLLLTRNGERLKAFLEICFSS
jgi:2-hydroxychromene-2-carboxylate isomerase